MGNCLSICSKNPYIPEMSKDRQGLMQSYQRQLAASFEDSDRVALLSQLEYFQKRSLRLESKLTTLQSTQEEELFSHSERIQQLESTIQMLKIQLQEKELYEKEFERQQSEKELENQQYKKQLERQQFEKELERQRLEKELERQRVEKELERERLEKELKRQEIEKEIERQKLEKELRRQETEKELKRQELETELRRQELEKELERQELEKELERQKLEKELEKELKKQELEKELEKELERQELERKLLEKELERQEFEKQLDRQTSLDSQSSCASAWDFHIYEESHNINEEEFTISAQLYKQRCIKTLRESTLQNTYTVNKEKYRAMPASEVFKNFGKLLDSKYEADCIDLASNRAPKPLCEYIIEFFKRINGLESLTLQKVCGMIRTLQKLYNKRDDYAIIICKMLQIIDVEPVCDELAWFLTKAWAEFHKISHKKEQLCMGDMINLVYALFETDKLCRALCFKTLKPDNLSVQNFLLFRICHKLLKLGHSGDHLFMNLDTDCNGAIDREEFLEGIKALLDLDMQDDEVDSLFDAMDAEGRSYINKDNFLTYINFSAYHHYVTYDEFATSISKFLASLIETYKAVQIRDAAFIRSALLNTDQYIDLNKFRVIIKKVDHKVTKGVVNALFEEALTMPKSKPCQNLVNRDNVALIIMTENLGGRGIRDFSNIHVEMLKCEQVNDSKAENSKGRSQQNIKNFESLSHSNSPFLRTNRAADQSSNLFY